MNPVNRLILAVACALSLVGTPGALAAYTNPQMTPAQLSRLVEAAELPPEILFDWWEMQSYRPCTGEGTSLAPLPRINQALSDRFSLEAFDSEKDTTFGYLPNAFFALEDQDKINELRSYLQTSNLLVSSASGDLLAGLILGTALEASEHIKLAIGVYLDSLANVQAHEIDETSRELIPILRARTASALLREPLTEVNLALGMDLLRGAEDLERESYLDLVRCTLFESNDLPAARYLEGPWVPPADEDAHSVYPPDTDFGSCEALLGDPQSMRETFDHYQALILQRPDQAERLMSEALESIKNHAGRARQPLSFGFMVKGLATDELLAIMADEGDFNLVIEESLDYGHVSIWAANLPLGLLFAEVLKAQGLEARCAGSTVKLDPSPGRADPATHLPRIIVSFMLSIDPPNRVHDAGEGAIRWLGAAEQLHYHGQIAAGRPAGRGRLFWNNSLYRIQGYFDGVYLENEVELEFPGILEFAGTFHRGLAHGFGHLIEENGRTIHAGNFINGRFTGHGRHPLDGNVIYSGTIVNSRPHGPGKCIGPHITYDCEFIQGRLVAVAGVPVPE